MGRNYQIRLQRSPQLTKTVNAKRSCVKILRKKKRPATGNPQFRLAAVSGSLQNIKHEKKLSFQGQTQRYWRLDLWKFICAE